MKRTLGSNRILRLFAGLACAGFLFLALPQGEARASEVATSRKFGLGGMLGQPTGITIKYFFTQRHALTAALGLGWWWGHNIHLHCDYGYHFMLTKTADFDLPLYIGAGLKFFVFYHRYYDPYWYDPDDVYYYRSRVGFGIRVPIGIAFHINKVPLDVFFEIVPGIAFFPFLDFFADGAIGVRYYF
jgi:hypothetical protein